MPRKRLTQKLVDTIKTDRNREEIWDSTFRLRGISLGLRITRSGTKTYFCRYRDSNACRRRITLGDAAVMTLRDAHDNARLIEADSGESHEPQRIVAETESVDKAQAPAPLQVFHPTTFGELCTEYLTKYAVQKKDGGKKDARIIRHDLLPQWESLPVGEIRRRDIIKLLDEIVLVRDAPVMANRVRALLSKMYNFAIEREIVTSSPCIGLPRKRKEKSKDRFLVSRAFEYFPFRRLKTFHFGGLLYLFLALFGCCQ